MRIGYPLAHLFNRDKLMPDPNHLLLREYDLCFMLIPKAANTAIKIAALGATGRFTDKELSPDGGGVNHTCMRLASNPSGPITFCSTEEAKKYFGIAVVRDPLDRLVSYYKDKVIRGRYGVKARKLGVKQNMSFFEFVTHIAQIPDCDSDQHWRQMTYSLLDEDGNVVPKIICHFESLRFDWQIIRGLASDRKLDLPPILSKVNESPKVDKEPIKVDEKTKSIVFERYAFDYLMLGYKSGYNAHDTRIF